MMRPKFIADGNLGKLVKWLRLLGYDTVYYRGNVDGPFIEQAQAEGRIGLTRCRQASEGLYPVEIIVIYSEQVVAQIGELKEKMSLEVARGDILGRCAVCNSELAQAGREEVACRVPLYVSHTYDLFKSCGNCGRVYWPGSHQKRIMDYLGGHNLWDHP